MEKKRLLIIAFIVLLFITAIILSFIYYKDKYKVAFETGTNESILTKYVSKNSKVEEPKSPGKKGYVFVEWQLNGEKYDFNSKIKDDIILTAKWIKEEYITVSYETNSDYSIDSKKILKGSSLSDLPIAYKDGYEFIGWFMNGKLYENEEVNDDAILVAQYKAKEINYQINDCILIVGSYSESAFSEESRYSVAIGWKRRILAIIEDSEYPYMVGNDTGVTGFFKASSIELCN